MKFFHFFHLKMSQYIYANWFVIASHSIWMWNSQTSIICSQIEMGFSSLSQIRGKLSKSVIVIVTIVTVSVTQLVPITNLTSPNNYVNFSETPKNDQQQFLAYIKLVASNEYNNQNQPAKTSRWIESIIDFELINFIIELISPHKSHLLMIPMENATK